MKTQVSMYIVWAVLILLIGVLEGITVQLVSIWFMLGSIGGLIAAFCGGSTLVQILVAIGISVLTLAVTRPIAKKKLAVTIQHTNADRCIGGEAVVLERIDNISETGSVKIDGKVWTARSSSGDIVESGEIVRVDKIDGVKLLVSKK